MQKKDSQKASGNNKLEVYVTSIFEIEEGHALPLTKKELVGLLDQEIVIPFHKRYCPSCHAIPGAQDWTKISQGTYFRFLFPTMKKITHHVTTPHYLITGKVPKKLPGPVIGTA